MKINGIEHKLLLVPEEMIMYTSPSAVDPMAILLDVVDENFKEQKRIKLRATKAIAQYQANAKGWVKGVVEELKLGDKCFMYNNCGDTFTEWNKGWEKGYNAAIDDVDTNAQKILDSIGG